MRLHFSIGGNDYRRTTRFRQSIHFSIIQILFADHVHRRSGVHNKFSFIRFKSWCRQAPIFRRWEECCSFFPLIFNTLLASFHAASRAPCSCHSVYSWDRSSNFGALGLRWWGSPEQIYPSEVFWSRIWVWHAIAFVNFTRWIGFRVSELFRKIDFGGFMSWKTRHSTTGTLSSGTSGSKSVDRTAWTKDSGRLLAMENQRAVFQRRHLQFPSRF